MDKSAGLNNFSFSKYCGISIPITPGDFVTLSEAIQEITHKYPTF
jgi:hypothetical protein